MVYAIFSQKQANEAGTVFYREVKTGNYREVSEVREKKWKSKWDDAHYFEVYKENPQTGRKPKKYWDNL